MTLTELAARLPELKAKFASAKPSPFVVIDDFLDPQLAEDVYEAFPTPEEMRVHGGDSKVLKGWQVNPKDENYIPKPPLEAMFRFLRDKELRRIVTEISGSKTEVLCDPEYVGAGLLAAQDKGIHKIHLDRNRHPTGLFCARLVLLIYFNKDWKPEDGGALELWDRKIENATRIEPLFNRCVIFENTRFSYHSITDVHLPPGKTRKALNFYFYSRDVPEVEKGMYEHNTMFFPRPHERAEWRRQQLTGNFPMGLISTLMMDHVPTAKLYLAVKDAVRGKKDNPFHQKDRAELIKAWEAFNDAKIV